MNKHEVQIERNRLIAQTDWTQLSDSPLTAEKKAEFAVYRQTLRDLPATFVDGNDPAWPELPQI